MSSRYEGPDVVFKLKTYESQAKLSVVLAIAGGLGAIAAAVLILQNFDPQNFWVRYNPKGLRPIAIGGALFVALVSAAVGLFVGLNSAGQRRNKNSKLSWTGFFMSAAALALAMSEGVFFYLTKYAVRPG
ncbi:MAG: hypothetical protein KKB50_09235 [Planctomycetes bacterium]|nr:hypothetical protein [Planctomycetota bacterium]